MLLGKLMREDGVSQRQLAKAAGYEGHGYIGRLLRGKSDTVEATAARRIARLLGVRLDRLFVSSRDQVSTEAPCQSKRPTRAA